MVTELTIENELQNLDNTTVLAIFTWTVNNHPDLTDFSKVADVLSVDMSFGHTWLTKKLGELHSEHLVTPTTPESIVSVEGEPDIYSVLLGFGYSPIMIKVLSEVSGNIAKYNATYLTLGSLNSLKGL